MRLQRCIVALALVGGFGAGGCSASDAPASVGTEATAGAEAIEAPVDEADDAQDGPVELTAIDVENPWEGLVNLGPDPELATAGDVDPSNRFEESVAQRCRRRPRPTPSPAAQQSFADGLEAARRGDPALAASGFEQALRLEPQMAAAAYNLGVLADRRGDQAAALQHYRSALSAVPDHEDAARGIVTIHLRRNEVPAAQSFIGPLSRSAPGNPHLAALEAEVMVAARRFADAWGPARRALSCDERFVPALIALVKASRGEGRDELAEAILAQALEVSSDHPELHFLRGMQLRGRSGFLREALAELNRAVAIEPDYSDARVALGLVLLEGGNYPEAVQHFEAASRLIPGSIAVRLNLADAYRANRQWPQALAEFETVLRMRPNLPEARYNTALLYHAAGADLEGLTELDALRKAVQELEAYLAMSGAGAGQDSANHYVQLWRRQIDRLERRAAMEAQAAQEARDAASRPESAPAAGEGGAAPGESPAPAASDEVQFFD